MTLVGAGATVSVIITALGRVAISILLAMAGAFALLRVLPSLPFGRRLVLETGMQADLGYVSAPESDRRWLGTDRHGALAAAAGGHCGDRRRARRCRLGRRLHRCRDARLK